MLHFNATCKGRENAPEGKTVWTAEEVSEMTTGRWENHIPSCQGFSRFQSVASDPEWLFWLQGLRGQGHGVLTCSTGTHLPRPPQATFCPLAGAPPWLCTLTSLLISSLHLTSKGQGNWGGEWGQRRNPSFTFSSFFSYTSTMWPDHINYITIHETKQKSLE